MKNKISKEMSIMLLLLGVLIILIIIFGLVANTLRKDNLECFHNPLVYGAKYYTDQNGYEFSCTCSLARPNSPIVKFDSHNLTVINQNIPLNSFTSEKFKMSMEND